MLTMKKPVIILVLIVLLFFSGYINHNLTLRANSKVSSDYQRYEEFEMVKRFELDEKDLVEAISEGDGDEVDIEILDTIEGKNLGDITQETNKIIGQEISRETSMQSKNYFIEQRLARDKLRASLIDRINEIVNNENTSDETRTEAQKKIMAIGDLAEKELTIEGLIKAKGFEEALVFLTEENLKIIVSVAELTEQDVVKILNIAMGETDLDADNIKIMKKY
ncbi:MAG: SpoIIIAH-like family protein [Tissierellia bacterium]|nr:SpoIIIAH-like family protein [Tissierellia bacterium]